MTTDSSVLNLLPSSDNMGMAGMLSDYSSIKNGSYGKLLKSYYNMQSEKSQSAKTGSVPNDIIDQLRREKQSPTVSKETSEANASLKSGLSGVKSDIASLQKSSTYEDTAGGQKADEKVASALKSFVSDYNTSVTASKKSNLGASDSVASMMQLTSDNASALADAGIHVNNDGTLFLDEKHIDTAKVKDLFSSEDKMSYGSKIASRATSAGYYAQASGASSSRKTADAETTKESTQSSGTLKSNASDLASASLYAKTKDANGNETYDVDKITSTAKSFVKNYNDTISSAKNIANSGVASNLSNMLSRTKNNASALNEIGITVSGNGTLSLNEDRFKSAGMEKVRDAFKDYGAGIASSAQLVNYYTTTQASPATDYTKNGAYNTASIISSFNGSV